ncbi:hypothetical protein JHK87_041797 [Glycine soja]|nr:hypothetical protein JHK87_041797 [Glycine soja]
MPSHSRILNHRHRSLPLHLSRRKRLSLPPTTSLVYSPRSRFDCASLEDSFDIPMLDDWNADDSSSAYKLSSSDGEDSDGEIFLTPVNDLDLPSVSASNNDALTVAAHRLDMAPTPSHTSIPRDMKRDTAVVAHVFAGSSSIEVSGAAGATIAFAAVGLLSDILSLTKNHWRALPALTEVLLENSIVTHSWVEQVEDFLPDIYNRAGHRRAVQRGAKWKMLVPLPLGIVYLGRCYQLLTSFCFVSMGHGVKLADALDGLAGGIAALAFTGMSIAVLPICSDLAIFGASMAGSCVGFLLHNRYKASVFMGNIGSLALGGALAAMAACTGMFFPLLISSGIFIVESLSVIIQVLYFKMTKGFQGAWWWRFLRIPPFHYGLQLRGFREPNIVLGAYIISSVLALLGGYVGLVSA